MNWISSILKRLRVLPYFSADDMINASTEDALREHSEVIEQARAVTKKREEGNNALRASIQSAKHRTNSFAEFEAFVNRRGDPKQ